MQEDRYLRYRNSLMRMMTNRDTEDEYRKKNDPRGLLFNEIKDYYRSTRRRCVEELKNEYNKTCLRERILKNISSEYTGIWSTIQNKSLFLCAMRLSLRASRLFGMTTTYQSRAKPNNRFSSLAHNHWIVHISDLMMLLLAAYYWLCLPVAVAFEEQSLLPWVYCNALLVFEILLRFAVRMSSEGDLTFRQTANRYIKSRGIIDLLMVIPYEIFLHKTMIIVKVIYMWAALVHRPDLNSWFGYLPSKVYSILTSVIKTAVLIHIYTCMWVYINEDDYAPVRRYLMSLYYTVATIVTVGYGDITPKTLGSKIYVCILIISGVMIYSNIISMISTSMIDEEEKQKDRRLNIVSQLYTEGIIDVSMMQRIIDCIEQSYQNNIDNRIDRYKHLMTHIDVVDSIQMYNDLYQTTIANNRLIRAMPNINRKHILDSCRYMKIASNEYVYHKDQIDNNIYMIVEGRVSCRIGRNICIKEYMKDGFFGDIEFMTRGKRLHSVRAEQPTIVAVIDYSSISKLPEQIIMSLQQTIIKRYLKYKISMNRISSYKNITMNNEWWDIENNLHINEKIHEWIDLIHDGYEWRKSIQTPSNQSFKLRSVKDSLRSRKSISESPMYKKKLSRFKSTIQPSENLANMMKSINNKMDEFAQLMESYMNKYTCVREKLASLIKEFDHIELESTRAKLIEILENFTAEPLGQSFEQLSKFVSYNQAKKKKKTLIHSVSVNLPKSSSKIIVTNKTFDQEDHDSISSLKHHEDEDVCSEWTHKGVILPEHFNITGRNRSRNSARKRESSVLYTFNNINSVKKIESIKKIRHETSADIIVKYL